MRVAARSLRGEKGFILTLLTEWNDQTARQLPEVVFPLAQAFTPGCRVRRNWVGPFTGLGSLLLRLNCGHRKQSLKEMQKPGEPGCLIGRCTWPQA